ncbi:MAG: PTS fructose transporter subunit IIA [Tenericutes bacterium HGW-Tenericutes-6]|nr:MAG: PTS fructose transporter subunit IIA [Tenericutes bacterium HGW-Tenericutes-6]PKK97215.1 MAG: PTS fructose transporter subunit IIA [Tenericutes bacterium HGW-Tenericutes-3]
MKIRDLIDLSLIKVNLEAKTKDQAIKELVNMLKDSDRVSNMKLFLEDVYEREALGSTGIGFKIAIPHTKSKYVVKPSLVFGKSQKGIEFESLDGLPAELFFMIAMPESDVNPHLKVLALLSRNLIHEEFREQLLQAKTNEEVLAILETIDKV